MVIKRDEATDVLPWEPPPLEPQIETRWYRGAYPWEEDDDEGTPRLA